MANVLVLVSTCVLIRRATWRCPSVRRAALPAVASMPTCCLEGAFTQIKPGKFTQKNNKKMLDDEGPHPATHMLTLSLTHPLTHSPTHHSLTHSLTHSFVRSLPGHARVTTEIDPSSWLPKLSPASSLILSPSFSGKGKRLDQPRKGSEQKQTAPTRRGARPPPGRRTTTSPTT